MITKFRKVSICLIWILTSPVSLSDKKTPTRQELQAVQAAIESQLLKLDSDNKAHHKLLNNLKAIENNHASIKKKIQNKQRILNQKQTSLNKLRQEQRSEAIKKQRQTTQIIQLLTNTYRLSTESRLKLFLNQENPDKISRLLIYADYINQSHSLQIATYLATMDQLTQLKHAIAKDKKTIELQSRQLIGERKKLANTIKKRSLLLSQLNARIQSGTERLEELEINEKKLRLLLKAVEKSISNISSPKGATSFAKAKGEIPKPVSGKPVNRFGKRIDNTSAKWQGMSFYSPIGNNVRAVHYGRIVFSGWFRGKGLLIIIDHGEGYMTLYAHNQSLFFETGDWVKSGDIIATVGNTGGLDHSELYFEIRHKGKALNPNQWLK